MRHGYGVRTSATFGLASHYRPKSVRGSLSSIPASEQADPASDRDRKIDDFRGGFVLKSRSDEPPARRRSLVEKSTNLKKSILQVRSSSFLPRQLFVTTSLVKQQAVYFSISNGRNTMISS
ncbi:hypothetical protein AVEN_197411-1 [Araneus ventricosus]|uniref:Uncharacterized protein n=1 Tax=Araneus ventricosus TaxID=182803 RepID=A0A4Y2EAN1_ARAVE|nr:hypothetical protein AVEN_247044-1 [Araneus ventricosus]GBO13258.1 hypothetical protein AVEN_197411-1 [Araneus ventricosus]